MRNNRGQGIMELIFAVGAAVLILSGAVVLIVNSLGSRNRIFDRKKAVELGNIIMEELVEEKRNNPDSFWQLNNQSDQSRASFSGYTYSVEFIDGSGEGGICDDGGNRCATARIRVSWVRDETKIVEFNKFFSRI